MKDRPCCAPFDASIRARAGGNSALLTSKAFLTIRAGPNVRILDVREYRSYQATGEPFL